MCPQNRPPLWRRGSCYLTTGFRSTSAGFSSAFRLESGEVYVSVETNTRKKTGLFPK